MAKWLAKEFDWDTGRYTGRYYDIAEAGIVAVFVDSFYGNDTAAGTAAAPFKTLSKAITTLNSTGANGSRIFMNGIFSETLPTQTYWYQFIGCGGGWNGRTAFYKGLSAFISFNKSFTKAENVVTINYNEDLICGSTGQQVYHDFLNCLLINTGLKSYQNTTVVSNNLIRCILYKPSFSRHVGGSINCNIVDSIVYDYSVLETGVRFLTGSNNYTKESEDSPVALSADNLLNTKRDVDAQFISVLNYDFNVKITSLLLNSGPIDDMTGQKRNIANVMLGLFYNGLTSEFSGSGGATITDLTIDATGKYTITAPATVGTLETALMDLGNIYPLENIDLFNVFDFASGEITQGVFETFSSPRMALTIKLKYGLTSAEVDDCPWLLIEYGKQPTFSGTGASRVGNAADTFDPDTFQTITCRYMKLFVTLKNNS